MSEARVEQVVLAARHFTDNLIILDLTVIQGAASRVTWWNPHSCARAWMRAVPHLSVRVWDCRITYLPNAIQRHNA
jgi:hypothetical protein